MKKILVVVDMQNDFIDGALGSDAAKNAVQKICAKLDSMPEDARVIFTCDSHKKDYLNTHEGKYLPVEHCNTPHGSAINAEIFTKAVSKFCSRINICYKNTFGTNKLADMIKKTQGLDNDFCIEMVGVCTDICVVSNALMLRAVFPEINISVDATCCAGTTKENHDAALKVMKSCHIDIYEE